MKTIGDYLKTTGDPFWSVNSDDSVRSVIKLMSQGRVKALPVLEAGRLVGIISMDDCINRVMLKGRPSLETRVREIMTSNLVTTYPAKSVEECLELMSEKHIQHLPVLTDGTLVGFVSMSDLLRTIIDDQKEYIDRLENYVMGVGYA